MVVKTVDERTRIMAEKIHTFQSSIFQNKKTSKTVTIDTTLKHNQKTLLKKTNMLLFKIFFDKNTAYCTVLNALATHKPSATPII